MDKVDTMIKDKVISNTDMAHFGVWYITQKLNGKIDIGTVPKELKEKYFHLIEPDDLGFQIRAACVKECPREMDDPFECKGWPANEHYDIQEFKTYFCETKSGHIGYGTDPFMGRYCMPDVNKIPKEVKDFFDIEDIKDIYNRIQAIGDTF